MTSHLAKIVSVDLVESPDQDTIEADNLRSLYADARNGLRRVVALGLYCYQIKARIKHGQFQAWLKANCPDVGFETLQTYLGLTKNALDACGVQMSCALDICQSGQIFLLPEDQIPDKAKKLHRQICDLIDGKTQRQLLLQFRSERPKGGDNIWEMWLRENHPELIKNGIVPPRNHVKKPIKEEFDLWQMGRIDPEAVVKAKQELVDRCLLNILTEIRTIQAHDLATLDDGSPSLRIELDQELGEFRKALKESMTLSHRKA